jgi:hypothetical protein
MHASQWFPLDEALQGFDADGELAYPLREL